ncbi:unnamed protein product [Rhizophagus irregularis]|nr:unnamed protein product [Rhizophagus irregularis]
MKCLYIYRNFILFQEEELTLSYHNIENKKQRILLKEILGYKTFRFSSQYPPPSLSQYPLFIDTVSTNKQTPSMKYKNSRNLNSLSSKTRKNNTEIIIEDDAHHRKRIWSYLERGSGKDQRRITIVGRGETRMRTVDDNFILNLETDDKIAFWMIIN